MTREEVVLFFGTDTSAIPPGLNSATGYVDTWIQKLKSMQTGYTGWWAQELKKREDMEVTSAVEAATRANRARRLMRERETIQAERQAVINTSIGGGSGGFGWVKKGEEAASGAGGMANAGKAIEEVGKEGRSMSTAIREVQVLIHEGLRGNFKRMIGSASILAGSMGLLGAVMAGLVITLPLTLLVGWKAWQTKKAIEERDQSEKDLKSRREDVAEQTRTRVEELNKAGKISDHDATEYQRQLKDPTDASLNNVLGVVNKLQKNGTAEEQLKAAETRKQMNELDEEHNKKQEQYVRDSLQGEARLVDDYYQRQKIMDKMNQYSRDSVEYKKLQLDLDEANHDILVDTNSVQEEKNRKLREAAEITKATADAQISMDEAKQKDLEKYMPTLAELSKHGTFRGEARAALRSEKRAKLDYESGNISGAQAEVANRNNIVDSLHNRGIIPERESLRQIEEIQKRLAVRLTEMGTPKSPIVTTPAMK